MTALIILGCILLFFVFLFSLRPTVTVHYSNDIAVSVRVLFLRIKILPKKQKKKKGKPMSAKQAEKLRAKLKKKKQKKALAAQEKKVKKQKKKEEQAQAPKEKKSMGEILDLIRLLSSLLGMVIKKFGKHLRIRFTRLKLTVATPDAATTAIAYGAATQSLSILLPLIESVKHVKLPKEGELDVGIDFTSDAPSFDLLISVSLSLWLIPGLIGGAISTFIKHKLKHPSRKSASSAPQNRQPSQVKEAPKA